MLPLPHASPSLMYMLFAGRAGGGSALHIAIYLTHVGAFPLAWARTGGMYQVSTLTDLPTRLLPLIGL